MSSFWMNPGTFGVTEMKQDLLFRELVKYQQEREALAARKTGEAACRVRFLRMFRIRRFFFRFAPRFAERHWAI